MKSFVVYYANFDEPGLTYETALFDLLNEHDVIGLSTDTLCNEQLYCADIDVSFPLHIVLQRSLGITFHEALCLEEWASDCADDGVCDAFYVAAPLRIHRGSGTPMNPVVIK